MKRKYLSGIFIVVAMAAILSVFLLSNYSKKKSDDKNLTGVITPLIITEDVVHDPDDPAIWLHPTDPSQSLIITTDKYGALFVFGLDGKMKKRKTVRGLERPNNVDVEYGFMLNGVPIDIAVATERYPSEIRVYKLPDMTEIDDGGIDVFEGESLQAPMGIALYKRSTDGAVFAIVSRKEGPTDGTYLWQYRLEDDGTGKVKGTKVREFGSYSGTKEIEALAVDDSLGYVYYADERAGVRKYYADPDAKNANIELALFATDGFTEDREGIAIYRINDGTGYIIVTDQDSDELHLYKREGEPNDPHNHQLVKVVKVLADESDGCEITNATLNQVFPNGLFVAMSDDQTFHFYSWADIAGDDLIIAPDGERLVQ